MSALRINASALGGAKPAAPRDSGARADPLSEGARFDAMFSDANGTDTPPGATAAPPQAPPDAADAPGPTPRRGNRDTSKDASDAASGTVASLLNAASLPAAIGTILASLTDPAATAPTKEPGAAASANGPPAVPSPLGNIAGAGRSARLSATVSEAGVVTTASAPAVPGAGALASAPAAEVFGASSGAVDGGPAPVPAAADGQATVMASAAAGTAATPAAAMVNTIAADTRPRHHTNAATGDNEAEPRRTILGAITPRLPMVGAATKTPGTVGPTAAAMTAAAVRAKIAASLALVTTTNAAPPTPQTRILEGTDPPSAPGGAGVVSSSPTPPAASARPPATGAAAPGTPPGTNIASFGRAALVPAAPPVDEAAINPAREGSSGITPSDAGNTYPATAQGAPDAPETGAPMVSAPSSNPAAVGIVDAGNIPARDDASRPTAADAGGAVIAPAHGIGDASGAGSTASATPSSSPATREIIDQASSYVIGLATHGPREIVMQLNPRELGALTVRVEVDGRAVAAWFDSPVPEVQQAIVAGISQLQTDLTNAGFNLSGAWVGGNATGGRSRGDNGAPAMRTAHAAMSAAAPVATLPAAARNPATQVSIYV